jgi:hypothetical protein
MSVATLNPAVAALAARKRPQPSEGDLTHLKSRIAYGREIEVRIADLQDRLAIENTKLSELRTRELVDLFEKIGISNIGIEQDGNLPAYDAKLKPYYSASLPKDEDKREQALALLKKLNASDLSKTKVEVQFGRGEEKVLRAFGAAMKKLKVGFSAKTGVHASTLTAWVRERFESGKPLAQSDLVALGATVGKVVMLEPRKGG